MISLTDYIPEINVLNAEMIKIRCLYDCYKDDKSVLFWAQNDGKAYISMTDGNMIIYNVNADLTELSEFTDILSPVCIFTDLQTLTDLNRLPEENVNVMYRKADSSSSIKSDCLSSNELYNLLDVDGLSLPEYPFFAVDYCRRLNRGYASYFAIKNKCAAITFNSGKFAIMNGIASHEKGYGSIALKAVMGQNSGRDFLVCCRNSIRGFYEKNGFIKLYNAGYWVKSK